MGRITKAQRERYLGSFGDKKRRRRKSTQTPKVAWLLGQRWEIIPWTQKFDDDPDDAQMGECYHERRELRIKANMHRDAQADTLLHEIVHAYQEMNYIELPKGQEARLEYLAQWTAAMMLDLIRNNPQLIRRLLTK